MRPPRPTAALLTPLRRSAAVRVLGLATALLAFGGLAGVHAVVHHLEHERAPAAARPHRHAPARVTDGRFAHRSAHGHRHVAGHHGPAPHRHARPVDAPSAPAPTPHHQHGDRGQPASPVHGQGSLEHLALALVASAPAVVPPAPTPALAPEAAAQPDTVPRLAPVSPIDIRGPPAAARA